MGSGDGDNYKDGKFDFTYNIKEELKIDLEKARQKKQ